MIIIIAITPKMNGIYNGLKSFTKPAHFDRPFFRREIAVAKTTDNMRILMNTNFKAVSVVFCVVFSSLNLPHIPAVMSSVRSAAFVLFTEQILARFTTSSIFI